STNFQALQYGRVEDEQGQHFAVVLQRTIQRVVVHQPQVAPEPVDIDERLFHQVQDKARWRCSRGQAINSHGVKRSGVSFISRSSSPGVTQRRSATSSAAGWKGPWQAPVNTWSTSCSISPWPTSAR